MTSVKALQILLPHVEEWCSDVITEGVHCQSCKAEAAYGVERAHAPGCELAMALAFARALVGPGQTTPKENRGP